MSVMLLLAGAMALAGVQECTGSRSQLLPAFGTVPRTAGVGDGKMHYGKRICSRTPGIPWRPISTSTVDFTQLKLRRGDREASQDDIEDR